MLLPAHGHPAPEEHTGEEGKGWKVVRHAVAAGAAGGEACRRSRAEFTVDGGRENVQLVQVIRMAGCAGHFTQ